MAAPQRLPVDDVLPELVAALAAGRNAVLVAPPGAGKTTRVPPALLDLRAAGQVLVLEPRRIAARSAARRIAAERGWELGREVGWHIRFERRFGPATRLLFLTEGILVQRLQRDPFLEGVAAVVFDEIHERTLTADLSLALARQVQREARPDLALVAMSATLEAGPLAAFLGDAPVVTSGGRPFPVTIRHLPRPDPRPAEEQLPGAVRQALDSSPGDVLVFLPGVGEIRRSGAALCGLAAERDLLVLALYGDLTSAEQDRVLQPAAQRKVVLATNVAETSITVDGVTAVVDSGLARQLRFDPATGLDRLELVRISRAAADQRAGRAGRQGPGVCLRLWTEAEERGLRPFERPEIERVDLAWATLQVAAWGEPEPRRFPWFQPPDPARLARALAELTDLGAIAARGVTPRGRELAALPLAPRLGRLVLEGRRLGVAAEAALLAALLADRDPWRGQPARTRSASRSDLLARLDALGDRPPHHLARTRDQLLALLARGGGPARGGTAPAACEPPSPGDAEEALLRAVAAAYLDRLCRRREPGSERAVMVGGRGVRLARDSAVGSHELFVAVALDGGGGERAEGLVRIASAVERSWLPAEQVATSDELVWDGERERVVARRLTRFHDLVLEEREVPVADPAAASRLLAAAAGEALDRALPLADEAVAGLLARLRFLAATLPELALPAVDESLLRALLPGLADGLRSFAELRRAPLAAHLLGRLDSAQRAALQREAPERVATPAGRSVRVDYGGERPVLAARIQELFGLADTPRLAAGRVPVLLHLLAPNGRPQQVTDDLRSFWNNTYPQVRRELAGRYPRHAWPLDPWSAAPERGPRRR